MNRTYRLIWNEARQAFVAVSEIVRAQGKRSGATVLLGAALGGAVLPVLALAQLPSGGQIVAGAGAISQSGNTMTVTQHSPRLAANWQSFSIGQGYAVHFVQPSATAVALNRVLGSDVSVIQGALRANGQVFLINPNGVLFTPTAQVEVGGLVASTLNLANEDFLAGRYRFAGDSTSSVLNQGHIKVGAGGTVALIAAKIENTGSIEAPRGNVLMGAGQSVTLDLGGPVKVQVEEGALNALIAQGGAIRADGGLVYLTAKAAGELASAAINHSGITEAKGIATGERGEIYLMGDMATGQLNVAGRLDAAGGFIETSAAKVKVADGASIRAGHWLIDPNDFTIAATGGDITGAAVSAALAAGDVTIQTTGGAASCTGVSGCGAGTAGNGDIFVRDDVTWSSGKTLTLSAHRNIEILATLDASGGGKVALEYGQGAAAASNTATYTFGLTGSGFTGKINLQAGNNFSTKLGSDGSVINWTVIAQLGSQGDESTGPANSLQGLAHSSKLSGNYVLGADIDASATSGWNSSEGFVPIGNGGSFFTGRFDGLGHVIRDLAINRSQNLVGLFGVTASSADIRNVGLSGGTVRGQGNVGALAGINNGAVRMSYATGSVNGSDSVGGLVGINNSTVSNSYATGSVTGSFFVGGLVGFNMNSTVSNSYATGSVSGGSDVGGLMGHNEEGTVSNSYATGSVTGSGPVGGLVGHNYMGTVENSYATGSVTGSSAVGGLVGSNLGSVSNSFWDTDTTGQATSAGGTGKSTAQMKQLATYTAAGWDIDDAGGTGKIWRIYDGDSYPLLRSFLAPLKIDAAASGSKTYDGVAVTALPSGLFTIGSAHDSSKILFGGSLPGQSNVGSYVARIYSEQSGYDLIGTRSVVYEITSPVPGGAAGDAIAGAQQSAGEEREIGAPPESVVQLLVVEGGGIRLPEGYLSDD